MGFILHNTDKYNFYEVCSHLKSTTNGFTAYLSCVFSSLLVRGYVWYSERMQMGSDVFVVVEEHSSSRQQADNHVGSGGKLCKEEE